MNNILPFITLKVIDLYLLQQLVEYIKLGTMKRFFALTAIAAVLAVVVASCGSSKGGHCEAYGSVNQVENSDLASK